MRARPILSTTLTLLALAPAGPAQTLVRTGRSRAGTATDVASGDLAVGSRAGARKDDIATPGAMTRRPAAAPALQTAGMTPAAR